MVLTGQMWIGVEEMRVQSLSVGEQMSAAGTALAVRPKVLLLDSAHLEFSLATRIDQLIVEFEQDCTIVMAVQDLQLASRVEDYIAFISHGELVEFGDRRDNFIKPLKRQTENFITGRFG